MRTSNQTISQNPYNDIYAGIHLNGTDMNKLLKGVAGAIVLLTAQFTTLAAQGPQDPSVGSEYEENANTDPNKAKNESPWPIDQS